MYHPLKYYLDDEYWHKMHHYGLGYPNGSDKNFDRKPQPGPGNGFGHPVSSNEYSYIVRKIGTQSNHEYETGLMPFSKHVTDNVQNSVDKCYRTTKDAVGCNHQHVGQVLSVGDATLHHPFHGSYTTGYPQQMYRR